MQPLGLRRALVLEPLEPQWALQRQVLQGPQVRTQQPQAQVQLRQLGPSELVLPGQEPPRVQRAQPPTTCR